MVRQRAKKMPRLPENYKANQQSLPFGQPSSLEYQRKIERRPRRVRQKVSLVKRWKTLIPPQSEPRRNRAEAGADLHSHPKHEQRGVSRAVRCTRLRSSLAPGEFFRECADATDFVLPFAARSRSVRSVRTPPCRGSPVRGRATCAVPPPGPRDLPTPRSAGGARCAHWPAATAAAPDWARSRSRAAPGRTGE
jgi:hypothetical protein